MFLFKRHSFCGAIKQLNEALAAFAGFQMSSQCGYMCMFLISTAITSIHSLTTLLGMSFILVNLTQIGSQPLNTGISCSQLTLAQPTPGFPKKVP